MKATSINELTRIVIGLACKIHTRLGPGCFEKVYEEIHYYLLVKLGYKVERQVLLPIIFDGLYINDAYKVDLLIENKLVVELKSVYPLPGVYYKQIRTQLSLLNLKNGLLLNFKEERMVEGIHRVFNNQGREEL